MCSLSRECIFNVYSRMCVCMCVFSYVYMYTYACLVETKSRQGLPKLFVTLLILSNNHPL